MFHLLNDRLAQWRPWRDMASFQREIDRFFTGEGLMESKGGYVPLNLYTHPEHGAKAVLSLPGWSAEWFDLSVDGEKLVLKGEVPEDAEGPLPRLRQFKRVLNLGFAIDAGSVGANYQDGLLSVSAGKHQDQKPRKIAIQTV